MYMWNLGRVSARVFHKLTIWEAGLPGKWSIYMSPLPGLIILTSLGRFSDELTSTIAQE